MRYSSHTHGTIIDSGASPHRENAKLLQQAANMVAGSNLMHIYGYKPCGQDAFTKARGLPRSPVTGHCRADLGLALRLCEAALHHILQAVCKLFFRRVSKWHHRIYQSLTVASRSIWLRTTTISFDEALRVAFLQTPQPQAQDKPENTKPSQQILRAGPED